MFTEVFAEDEADVATLGGGGGRGGEGGGGGGRLEVRFFCVWGSKERGGIGNADDRFAESATKRTICRRHQSDRRGREDHGLGDGDLGAGVVGGGGGGGGCG